MGYHRAGFEVVGVDIKPQKHFPFEFHQADAMTYPLEGFDVIHASPPCQRYSQCTPKEYKENHPDLIDAVRDRITVYHRRYYVIENVSGARHLLLDPIMLCGSMFGLRVRRHRYFETWPPMSGLLPQCNHREYPICITGTTRRKSGRFEDCAQDCRNASKLYWMTRKEMDEAIPPAYTEWIGRQLMETL